MQLQYSNLQVEHWNPGATAPLVLPVRVICNTPEDDLHRNIAANARRPAQLERRWLKSEDAHNGVAILVGSGPSLADTIEAVRAHADDGATIIALNGAAAYLDQHGIFPDWQVMIDPRAITASLIGPARDHLIASQCHADVFDRLPNAKLYHLQIIGIDDDLPDYPHTFALVGGGASVGNTAAILAFVMGFRTLHLYGYDSSHRDGAHHAFRQSINDGEPCASVVWNGKHYRTSLTMKLQAEKFHETGRLLQGEGVAIHIHGAGLLPDMWNTPHEELSEREKYQRMWSVPSYREYSPGQDAAKAFLDVVQPEPGATVIDFGCGTGRGGLVLSKAGLEVVLVDFASNSRDTEAMRLPFLEHDLTQPCPLRAPYGYCCDVMEHIPPASVDAVLNTIAASVGTCFFTISHVFDRMGVLINQDLHLTVEDAEWWTETLGRHFASVTALGDGKFICGR